MSGTPKRALLVATICLALLPGGMEVLAEEFTVQLAAIKDKKAVFATVESTDSIPARVRISGTISKLGVSAGDEVREGQVIALVRDPKLDLQIEAIDAQIRASQSAIANLKTELKRVTQLFQRGSTTKARLDQVTTQVDVATNGLEAERAQKAVIVHQLEEGAVLAPQAGRVLDVLVTVGSVVMPGEPVATIAKDHFILRLALPERHARFLQKGDPVEIAGRGLDCDTDCSKQGEIDKVYPKIANGRVLADAIVDELGDYFVGERIKVRVGAGERQTYLVPRSFVFTRHGIDFVKAVTADGSEIEIAVQMGQSIRQEGVTMAEILSGLQSGDRLVQP